MARKSARESKRGEVRMKRVLLAILLLFILMGCSKQPEDTTANDEPIYPYVDDEGRLNVDVSDYEFE